MKSYNLYQCDLEKANGSSAIRTTTWLPEKFAVEGKVVEIKIGVLWSNGWIVRTVHRGQKKTYEDMVKYQNDYKHTREASDV